MKYFKVFLLILALAAMVSCRKSGHFIQDKTTRDEVSSQFEKRKTELAQRGDELFKVFNRAGITLEQKEALEFLYAYMSLNDLGDYDGNFFYRQVKSAFDARDYFSWGEKVPEDLFRHFVLPPRINNEDLDTARMVFFDELKNRIKGMSMADAALEVNHWCHEKVTYRSADARTSSPLASVRTGYGRCGEESTFTVAALRSVCIPARQCYTPRWAHSDDNHAWVEVWCDGKWYFMGACEPEAELNKAWFSGPVKRAMMVHTNVFGKYTGPESKTEYPLYTKINVLPNYTDTRKLVVTVLDNNGKTIEGAEVDFGLYNYTDYYPVHVQKADKEGRAEIISGLGDLLVWATKDGKYNYQKVSLVNTDKITLKLDRLPGTEYEEDMDINPPVEKKVASKNTSTGNTSNVKRLRLEDSIRGRYLSTFMTKKEALALAEKLQLDTGKTAMYILKSEGNYKEISSFIKNNAKNKFLFDLLSTLTDKDLRDVPAKALQSHLDHVALLPAESSEAFVQGILSPRISTELIRDWRPFLQEKFKTVFSEKTTMEDVKKWVISNIVKVEPTMNYSRCLISPAGVYQLRKADQYSRDVFFVALCRSFNIPAKIDQATSEIKQFINGSWITFYLDPEKPVKSTGTLTINYSPENSLKPHYLSHYSLAKYEDGIFVQLDYEDDPRVAGFQVVLALEEGYYRLTTGNRYPDGRVLAHNEYFNITKDKESIKELKIRKLEPENKFYGNVHPAEINRDWYSKNGMVICFLDPDKEPTKHVMNDIALVKNESDKWPGNFIFVVPESNLNKGFSGNQYKNLPVHSTFVTSGGNTIMKSMLKSSDLSITADFPEIFMVNQKGEIMFHSNGYRIGIGDLILKTLGLNRH